MSLESKNRLRRKRRALRVKSSLVVSGSDLTRVSVYRSLNYIYGQLIDDVAGKTLASCSSLELKGVKGDKRDVAKAVGLELAKKAAQQGVSSVRLDRGRFLYHGRVQAFADGLREGGLKV